MYKAVRNIAKKSTCENMSPWCGIRKLTLTLKPLPLVLAETL